MSDVSIPDTAHAPAAAPSDNPLLSNTGPAAWARRMDRVDYTVHGTPRIRPLRDLPDFFLEPGGPEPRGMTVVGGDGVPAGTVVDVWVDTAEPQVRLYEMEVAANGRRVLVPYGFVKIHRRSNEMRVKAIYAAHFAEVPATRSPGVITLREEDRIMAYFAAGYLWADADRAEPLL